ncbi:FAD binding domain-containing protein [Phaeosphaeria sp. MPI-PUGE-AT-0046c]|nr:FAD binding domain-containing protein [Phaeosphaeria sp. MPI-PUGE-AT-0046c]
MRFPYVVSLSLFLPACGAQDVFDSADLNVAEVLKTNGVDLSVLPSSSELGVAVLCNTLELIFGEAKVETRNESAYTAVINSFWSARQQEAKPYCIFKPTKAQDVSTFILLSRLTKAPFAVKSGGHAAFQGASNINNGVTLTFSNMKAISLSSDKSTVYIQSGNTWYDVYTSLEKDNLAVIGGRVSGIGVGGLTLGGGISFFSNEYGWACDNVASYEVVLASGQIVTASPSSHADLYLALRGGGPNFGIVTSFELETFAHGPVMFGGQRVFLESSFPSAIDAFVNLGSNPDADPKAAQYLAIALDVASNTRIAVAELTYSEPDPEPAVFAEYRAIEALSDSGRVASLANLTQELDATNPSGFRETYWTASSLLDREMVQFVVSACFEEFSTLANVSGIIPANALQIITVAQLEQMQKKSGNALGLDPTSGPIFLLNLNMRWDKAEDDERVLSANRRIVSKMQEEAKRRDMEVGYLYMNYASEEQHVLESYGKVETDKLRAVAAKYDPARVFQELMPGYFKLDREPKAV